MDVKSKCELTVNKMVAKIASKEEIGSYLEMMARFPQMGMENILLLLSQLPDATVVCGKGAWKQYGAVVKEGKKPVALLGLVESVPEYEDEEVEEEEEDIAIDFGVVAVYDISQVNISDKTPHFAIKNELKMPVEQLLREKYGLSIIEDTSGENIPRKTQKSLYRHNEKTVYLKRGITLGQIEAELAKIYVKVFLDNSALPDFLDVAEHYLAISLSKCFGIACADDAIRPTELFDASVEEKKMFLRSLSASFFAMVCELAGKELLSFDETALCNILFSSPNKDDVYASCGSVLEMAGTQSVREITKNFQSRVLSFDEDVYKEVKKRRDMQILFSFPPAVLNE